MINFAVIGVGGYIAPRHLEAINKVGGRIVAALDPNDSVGIMDRYSPDAMFFTSTEKFQSFIASLKGTGKEIQFVSICSPNFLHFSHIKLGLELGANVICEKPLVFTTAELNELKSLEKKHSRRVNTILQLRLHEKIIELRNKSQHQTNEKIDLNYVTSRGPWYHESWKGNKDKSGGLSTNIGVHFFDMLSWIWGPMESVSVSFKSNEKEAGFLKLKNANINWKLSISLEDVPADFKAKNQRTFRSIKINNQEFEFSEGFTDLHNQSYENILNGDGFGIDDIFEATKIVETIRGFKI
jgi:UDP-N-acetyl-2-amino-2-deoxyglucuronate dehydrogenase